MTLKEARSFSEYKLRELEFAAKYKNDSDALYTLSQINIRLKREANDRLERLERAGYKQYAYDLATTYTKTAYKSNRFKGVEITDAKDLRKQIRQMQVFLDKRSSLLEGQKEIEKARIEKFKTNPVFADWSNRRVKSFLKFLGDKTTRSLVDANTKVSGENIERLWGAFNNTKRSELDEMIQRYTDSENGIYTKDDEDFLGYDELLKFLDDKASQPFKKRSKKH